MSETIALPVSVGENEKELAFMYEDDVITLKLDNKELCWFEFEENFKDIMKRMLEIWK